MRIQHTLVAALLIAAAGSARASLLYTDTISILGTSLGLVNTLITVHDPGGTGNQNGTESGCINQDGSFSPCLVGVEGGDNTLINQVLSLPNTMSFAAVVTIAEDDFSATLTDLYLTFVGANGTFTSTYDGPDRVLTEGSGTGTGGAAFVFGLDAAQYAIVSALGPNVTISGAVCSSKTAQRAMATSLCTSFKSMDR